MSHTGKLRVALGAFASAAALAALPAGAQAEEVCPENVDVAVKNGAQEPERGQFCEPPPKTGRQVCTRGTRLPSRLTLTLRPSAGGVRLGASAPDVCSRWGRPALQIQRFGDKRRTWIYGGGDVPSRSEYEAWVRANDKMSWIISWCRYNWQSTDPCRPADRAAAAESAGDLGRLLEVRMPISANWVEARFDERGRLVGIFSWRPADRAANSLKSGSPFPVSERCRLIGTQRLGTCPVGPNRVRGNVCTTSLVTNQVPLGGILSSGYGREREYGTRVRMVGLSSEVYGPTCEASES